MFLLTAPLDIETIIIANFAGTVEVFLFIFTIFIAAMAARFRMPNIVAVSMFAVFVIFLSGTSLIGSVSGLYVIIVICAALSTYLALSKAFRSQ